MEDDSVENSPNSSWASWSLKKVMKWTFTGAIVISGVAFLGYLVSKSLPRKQIEDKKSKKARCTCKETDEIQVEDVDELDIEKQKAKNKQLEAETVAVVAPSPGETPISSPTVSDNVSTPSEDKRFFDFIQLYAAASDNKPRRSRSFSSLPQLDETQRVNHAPNPIPPHSATVTQSVPLQPRRLSQTPHIQQAAQQALQNSPPQPVSRPITRETITYASTQPMAHRRRTSEPAFCTAENPSSHVLPAHLQSHHARAPSAPLPPNAPSQTSSRFSSPIQTSSGPILSPSSRNNPPPLALQSPQSRNGPPPSSRYPPPSISTQSPRFAPRPGSHSHTSSPHPLHSPNAHLPPQHTSPSQLRHDIPVTGTRMPSVNEPSVQYDPRSPQLAHRTRGDSVESKSRR